MDTVKEDPVAMAAYGECQRHNSRRQYLCLLLIVQGICMLHLSTRTVTRMHPFPTVPRKQSLFVLMIVCLTTVIQGLT